MITDILRKRKFRRETEKSPSYLREMIVNIATSCETRRNRSSQPLPGSGYGLQLIPNVVNKCKTNRIVLQYEVLITDEIRTGDSDNLCALYLDKRVFFYL